MRNKSNRKLRNQKRNKFQFELLEPRQMFSVSGGLSLSDLLAYRQSALEPHVESPDAPEEAPPIGGQVDQSLNNFLYLPMVSAGPNASVNTFATLQLNAEVIVNVQDNLALQWSKLSGPGTATFENAQQEKTTVQFDQAGTYVLQLAATNHGVTALSQLTVNVTFVNAINIDQAWLDARGDGPYYLDQAGRTYVLQTDVTTDGTAFAIIAKDVTFDLNGHTITYNNAAPITIPNGSFEQGSGTTATGWNFANAPSATRHQGVWLYNETYDGDYSLKFSDTTKNQYVSSTSKITLEPNTTYSLSAMFESGGQGNYTNPGVKGYVRLIGTNGEPTREVFYAQTNWRGIQLREGVFKTGDSAETYTVQVGIEGHDSSTKPFYIDDIKIQKTQNYGVVVGPRSWGPGYLPDVAQYGDGSGATIKNGTITQGVDGGTKSHGVFIYADGGVVVDKTDITIHGANSSAILGYDIANKTTTITNNTLTSNVQTITNRDAFDGAVVKTVAGIISNNTVTNGPHAGFFLSGSIPSEISDNTIQLKAKYTNAFAIIGGGPGGQIFNNTISNGTGEYASRGIMVSSGTEEAPTKVYNNTIAVQNFANNQEYGGIQSGGTYGIQAESVSYAEIYENDVTVYGTTLGYAMRFTSESNDLSVHDNTFRAIATSGNAFALAFYATTGSSITFEDNTLITNDGIVGDVTQVMDFSLIRTTFEVDDAIGSPTYFRYGYASGSGVHSSLNFIDTVFADTDSQTFFENATVTGVNPTEANRVQVALAWTTTIAVKDGSSNPVEGASVTIKDKNNNTVYTGTTDAAGKVITTLKQQSVTGDTKTTYNGYTVTVTKSGYSFNPRTVTANKTQSLTMQPGAAQQQSLNQTGSQDPAQLALQAFLTQRVAEHQTVEEPQETELAIEVFEDPDPESRCDPAVQTSPTASIATNNMAQEEVIDEAYANLSEFLMRRTFARQIS